MHSSVSNEFGADIIIVIIFILCHLDWRDRFVLNFLPSNLNPGEVQVVQWWYKYVFSTCQVRVELCDSKLFTQNVYETMFNCPTTTFTAVV